MNILEYKVTFTTPAFLGNAEQSGQWRSPPFKALLRQWWRVAVAPNCNYDYHKLREDELRLFGTVAEKSSKSLIRIRLDKWSKGSLTQQEWGNKETWQGQKIPHPEVGKSIGPLLYLGYGPLEWNQNATKLKRNAAIQAGESAKLSIATPDESCTDIQRAIALMNAYGTIGGRSRNGWGSFCLATDNDTPALSANLTDVIRHWEDALRLDWPHAIGASDDIPLIWQTKESHTGWEQVMRELAVIKIALRTQFRFDGGQSHPEPQNRHWLSYPITHHRVESWSSKSRLPNSLRFKVRQAADNNENLHGVIIHVPCLPPSDFQPDNYKPHIKEVWRKVHNFLDRQDNLIRSEV